MANFQTKKSVMAIVEETTEGTAVAPGSGANFISLQDGFEVNSEFESIENLELTGSIGAAKAIQGLEVPTASLSHYLKPSGVQGTAPNWDILLKMAFGAKSTASTEYNTVAGSTAGTSSVRAVINVDAGEGATFERGEALLIKDGTNGYQVRNIYSIATDALSLAFNLSAAPAAAVDLGRAVLYKPAGINDTFPTATIWDYRANGAAIQTVVGSRVTEMAVTVEAGQLINGEFSLTGLSSAYDPILITATTDTIDFNDGAVKVATVDAKLYKHPHELASALETAMNAVSTGITVIYSDSTGKYTIAKTAGTLSLLWNTGANTAQTIGGKLGFITTSDDTGFLTYTGDNPIDLTAPFTPTFDAVNPPVAKNNQVLIGDIDDILCFQANSITATLSNEPVDVLSVCSESGKSGTVITGRAVTIEMQASLPQYDADKFRKFLNADTIQFAYTWGEKSGGNWVAGKVGNMYIPTGTVTAHTLVDNEGLVDISVSIQAFVDSGAGEFYLNFL